MKKRAIWTDALARIGQGAHARAAGPLDRSLGNAAELLAGTGPPCASGRFEPDLVTDQTSAHDLINGYLPIGWSVERWRAAQADPRQHETLQRGRGGQLRGACARVARLALSRRSGCSTTATTSARSRSTTALPTHSEFPGFVPAYIRPLFCVGKGAVSLGRAVRRPAGHTSHRCQTEGVVPGRPASAPLARYGFRTDRLPGGAADLLARLGERQRAGLAFNQMVASGELAAPIVIGRDHLDAGSVASPNRETEAMRDGSDAVSDWPLLNAMLNTASGATWVSLHHGEGRDGLLAACRGRDRVRRQRSGGAPDRARSVERSGQRG